MKLVILTTTYNCEKYIERSIYSIMSQSYKNFICYITDDMSTDNTTDIIKKIIKDDNRFILIQNKSKFYQAGNYDQVIRNNENVDDNDICVEVDGDDWLPDAHTFKRIVSYYENNDVWLANGRFKYSDGRPGFAQIPNPNISIRKQTFTLSHIRSWKAFLWRKIKPEDLRDDSGNYWNAACDLSFMFPMYEMSVPNHYGFMNDINYIYNETNPLNEHKVIMKRVQQTIKKVRNMKPYERL